MKKLTIEEKAKLYDEAIEKLRDFYRDYDTVSLLINVKEELANIFPELKESEDEKIREKVIDVLKLNIRGAESQMQASRGVDRTFEVYACNKVIALLEKQGKQTSDPRYIILDKLIEADNIYQMSVNDAMVQEAKTKAIDALSKLEIGNLLELEKQGEQKPAWSEEDNFMYNKIKNLLTNISLAPESRNSLFDWLKDLKDRVQPQPKQEWSEEDEKMIEAALQFAHEYGRHGLWSWLKGLKYRVQPQTTWRPNDEQIVALRWVLNNVPYNKHKEEISGLIEQINKLREE